MIIIFTSFFTDFDSENVATGDLLSSVASVPVVGGNKPDQKSGNSLLEFAEFEDFPGKNNQVSLTSNVAILAGEFAKPAEEEVDDFDAAFDALAQVFCLCVCVCTCVREQELHCWGFHVFFNNILRT